MSRSPTRRTARPAAPSAPMPAPAPPRPRSNRWSCTHVCPLARKSARASRFSNQQQQAILKKYAAGNGFALIDEFIDVETAK